MSRRPSSSASVTARPSRTAATTVLVVPRSIPTATPMVGQGALSPILVRACEKSWRRRDSVAGLYSGIAMMAEAPRTLDAQHASPSSRASHPLRLDARDRVFVTGVVALAAAISVWAMWAHSATVFDARAFLFRDEGLSVLWGSKVARGEMPFRDF